MDPLRKVITDIFKGAARLGHDALLTHLDTSWWASLHKGLIDPVEQAIAKDASLIGKPKLFRLSGEQPYIIAPLEYAVANNRDGSHYDIIRLLLDHGAAQQGDTAQGGPTALMMACKQDDLKMVQLLLQYANPPIDAVQQRDNMKGHTALSIAVVKGNYEAADLLLAFGADVNASTTVSPLEIAENRGDREMIKLLTRYLPELPVTPRLMPPPPPKP